MAVHKQANNRVIEHRATARPDGASPSSTISGR